MNTERRPYPTGATILNQLGGKRFIAMTGAKHFVGGPDTLQFKIPVAKSGINCVLVKLEPNDTYTMRFMRVAGVRCTDVAEVELVYADNLQYVFTLHTGLDTHL